MTVYILEARRSGETEDDYTSRAEAYWRQLEVGVQKLQDLRDAHTGKVPKPKRGKV